MSSCYFKSLLWLCNNNSDLPLTTAGPVRVRNIIKSSELRGDGINIDLKHQLFQNDNLSIECHRNCVSTYTSKFHIKRHLLKADDQTQSTSSTPPVKRACRSTLSAFQFQTHCLFCGELCQLETDPRHPDRWRKVSKCSTAGQGDEHDFKQAVIDVCARRNDDRAEQVHIRLQGAISDLHAADAIYHRECHAFFMAPRSVMASSRRLSADESDHAFHIVLHELERDPSRIWNAVELHNRYLSHLGSRLVRRKLITELVCYFGDDLVVLSGNGVANLLVFA